MEHITDDDIERYYLGMIPRDSVEAVALEDHLLVCAECVERAEESEAYMDAIRAGIIAGDFDLEV